MERIDVFAPLASLQWVDRNTIHANDYNPGQRGEPEAAGAVHLDQRLDVAHRGTPGRNHH